MANLVAPADALRLCKPRCWPMCDKQLWLSQTLNTGVAAVYDMLILSHSFPRPYSHLHLRLHPSLPFLISHLPLPTLHPQDHHASPASGSPSRIADRPTSVALSEGVPASADAHHPLLLPIPISLPRLLPRIVTILDSLCSIHSSTREKMDRTEVTYTGSAASSVSPDAYNQDTSPAADEQSNTAPKRRGMTVQI
jgi:hypothetical protein